MLNGNKMSQPPKYKTESTINNIQNSLGQNSHSIWPDRFVSYRVLRNSVCFGNRFPTMKTLYSCTLPLQWHFHFWWVHQSLGDGHSYTAPGSKPSEGREQMGPVPSLCLLRMSASTEGRWFRITLP